MYLLAMQFSTVIDIVLVVALLVFAIVGLCKGFIKQLVGLVSTIAALVIAYFFCDKLADLLMKSSIGTSLAESVKNLFGESWNVELPISELAEFIKQQNLPSFISNAITKAVEQLGEIDSVNFAEVASSIITKYIFVAISYLVLGAIAKLVFFLVEKLLAFIIRKSPLKIIDRILGLILCLIKGLLIVWLVLLLLSVLSAVPSLEGLKTALEESVVAKFLSEVNPFTWLVGLVLNKS